MAQIKRKERFDFGGSSNVVDANQYDLDTMDRLVITPKVKERIEKKIESLQVPLDYKDRRRKRTEISIFSYPSKL